MPSLYDKLGDLLSGILEAGEMPVSERPHASAGKSAEAGDGAKARIQSRSECGKEQAEKAGESPKANRAKASYDRATMRHCAVLNIPPGSGARAVKAAYRAQLKKYHPDAIPAMEYMQRTASEKTKEIVEAYRFLLAAAEKDGLP